jgi:hypothetical protein
MPEERTGAVETVNIRSGTEAARSYNHSHVIPLGASSTSRCCDSEATSCI